MNPLLLVSPNGQRWSLSVDNNGNLSANPVPNPPALITDSSGTVWQVGINPDGTLFTQKTTVVKQP